MTENKDLEQISFEDRNVLITQLFSDTNAYFPQNTDIGPDKDPMALKTALILLQGEYKGKQIRLSYLDYYAPDVPIAKKLTNSLHQNFSIPKQFGDTDEDNEVLTTIYTAFRNTTIEMFFSLITEEVLRSKNELNIGSQTLESLLPTGTSCEEFLEKNPEIKRVLEKRITLSLEDIDNLVKKRRDLFHKLFSEDRTEIKTQQEEIETQIKNILGRYKYAGIVID